MLSASTWAPVPYVAEHAPSVHDLKPEGFVIAFPDSANVIVLGKDDNGTRHGVYEFLETFVGVRWLFPGPFGEHVPSRADAADSAPFGSVGARLLLPAGSA